MASSNTANNLAIVNPLALRDYQEEAIQSVAASYQQGVTRQLVALVTGGGKSVILAQLPEMFKYLGRTLVIAHREELLDQNAAQIERANPHLRVEVEQAQRKASDYADVVVASVQTLSVSPHRLERLNPESFGVVIVDEVHHLIAKSYVRVLARLGLAPDISDLEQQARSTPNNRKLNNELAARYKDFRPAPNRLLVGFTATPHRTDGLGLEYLLDKMVYSKTIVEMMRLGWLCKIRGEKIQTGVNISGVRRHYGDFREAELAAAVNREERNSLAVKMWLAHAIGRPTLVFCVNVEHTIAMAETFQAAGVRTGYVIGNMPDDQRADTLAAFKSGELDVVTNCQVLCLDEETEILTQEGWIGIDDMTYAHRVANWEDGQIFFAEPEFIVRRDRLPGEKMVSLNTPRISLRVTEHHRLLYRKRGEQSFSIEHASKLAGESVYVPVSGRADPICQEVLQETTPSRKRAVIKNSCILRTKEWDEPSSRIEAARRFDERYSLRYKRPEQLTVDECKFIGFWLGDGSKNRLQTGGVEFTLSQSNAYPKIIEWVDTLVANLSVDSPRHERFYPSRSNGHVRWSFSRGTGFGHQKRKGVYHLEPYLKKGPNPLWWGLDEEQFAALVLGLWYADGNHKNGNVEPIGGFAIHNTDYAFLSLLQAVAVCRGYRASLQKGSNQQRNPSHSQNYILWLKKQEDIQIGAGVPQLAEEKDWQPEGVWCVTSTTGNIITRRKGYVTVTGNTEGYDHPPISCIVMARPTSSSLTYTQALGRGTRIHPGKEDLLVLDLVDINSKARVASVNTIVGLPPNLVIEKDLLDTVEAIDDITTEVPVGQGVLDNAVTVAEVRQLSQEWNPLEQATVPDELASHLALAWCRTGWGFALGVSGRIFEVKLDMLNQASSRIRGGKDYKNLGQFEDALGAMLDAERYIQQVLPKDYWFMRKDAKWLKAGKSQPATEKQLYWLQKKKVPHPQGISKADATTLLNRAFAGTPRR